MHENKSTLPSTKQIIPICYDFIYFYNFDIKHLNETRNRFLKTKNPNLKLTIVWSKIIIQNSRRFTSECIY